MYKIVIHSVLAVILILVAVWLTAGCATTSYVQAPSTTKVQANVTEATQANKQLKGLSAEERNLDVRKSNKDQIIDRWYQTHSRQ